MFNLAGTSFLKLYFTITHAVSITCIANHSLASNTRLLRFNTSLTH